MINSKRIFDITTAVAAAMVLSPVLAVVGIACAVEHRGWPLHKVDRAGKDGARFSMFKFKTMRDTRDENGVLLPDAQRVTKLGSFLRKSSLDEVPQLINIIMGDMSIVGPRPRMATLKDEDYIPETHRSILKVRPGLTGVWQVAVIGKQGMDPKAKLDMERDYAEKAPDLAADLKLVVKTVPSFYKGHGGETFRK